ncbi:hypothetical protein RB195_017069 [Necator americanus]|uniref:Uncharacterized protein n=1 Tax=Necator americanus TaxID=51031 RepID=A0ABR1C4Z1_NECAM
MPSKLIPQSKKGYDEWLADRGYCPSLTSLKFARMFRYDILQREEMVKKYDQLFKTAGVSMLQRSYIRSEFMNRVFYAPQPQIGASESNKANLWYVPGVAAQETEFTMEVGAAAMRTKLEPDKLLTTL